MGHSIKKIFRFCLLFATIFTFSCIENTKSADNLKGVAPEAEDYTRFVDPFIGTQHEGHTFPGPTAPLGMVKPGPESYNEYYPGYEMDHCAGYQYNDPWIWGFTQTHLNGGGIPSMSDILLLPFCNNDIDPAHRKNFISSYDKESEEATPGYYKVFLNDHHVNVELTATERVAYHRYSYDQPESAKLLIDLQYNVSWDINTISDHVSEAYQQFEDGYTLTGYRKAGGWTHRDLFYVIKFNKKITDKKTLEAPENKDEKAPRFILEFDMNGSEKLEVLIGVSTVGIEEARANLKAEVNSWESFDKVRQQTKEKWNKILSKIELKGDDDKKTAFYTSLYHLYIQPVNIADIAGKYRSGDDGVKESTSGKFFTTLSLWDTYRAAHPMYTILSPDLVSDVLTSMMDSYEHMTVEPENPREANKYLPRWQLWGRETHVMVGNHAVPVFVDAYLKGIKSQNYSDEQVFEAIWSSVAQPHYRNHVELVDSFGYIPYDVQLSSIDDGRETVSRLLENIYDDYCAALFANELGRKEEKLFLENRAGFYKNVYHPESGFMRGRNSKGEFKSDVDPLEVVGEWLPGSDFTEGNAWHYLFHVQHDIPGLMKIMGGNDVFVDKLDSMFYTNSKPVVKTLEWNIFGTKGQYWHGNEPCHHVAYLYKYTDQPDKSDIVIKDLVDNYYQNRPDGLSGNDDSGQMSAWYMFSVMGFYPVNPCGGQYILGAPQVSSSVINLPGNRQFRITAKNLSEENFIVKNVTLNGTALERNYIMHEEIQRGGELVFEMTAKQN